VKINFKVINLFRTALAESLQICLRSLELFPRLGILRPILSSFKNLRNRQHKELNSVSCPNLVHIPQGILDLKNKIIEITTLSQTAIPRGVGHYLERLFSEIESTSIQEVVFLSFTSHEKSTTLSRIFYGRNIYHIDSDCLDCITFLQQIASSAKKFTFTSYFHENISPETCSHLLATIPNSIVIIYDLIPKSNPVNFSSLSSMRIYFSKYVLLKRAKLYTISRSIKSEIESQGLLVENVIKYRLTKRESLEKERDKNILLFGSTSPRKNILRTVMAWDLVQADFPECKLTLVGHYGRFSKSLILGVLKSDPKSIYFTGEISDLEIDSLFEKSSLLIAPSTAEGLGLPLIKAIEFGIPLICASIGPYHEIVPNKESFFNPYSVHDISKVMHHAITSPEKFINNIEDVQIGLANFSEII